MDTEKLIAAKAALEDGKIEQAARLVMESRVPGVRLDKSGLDEAIALAEAGEVQEAPDTTSSNCQGCRGL